jgi:hypothetical protein
MAEVVYVLANNHYMGFGPGTIQLVQEVLGLPRSDLSKAMGAEHQSRLDRFADS